MQSIPQSPVVCAKLVYSSRSDSSSVRDEVLGSPPRRGGWSWSWSLPQLLEGGRTCPGRIIFDRVGAPLLLQPPRPTTKARPFSSAEERQVLRHCSMHHHLPPQPPSRASSQPRGPLTLALTNHPSSPTNHPPPVKLDFSPEHSVARRELLREAFFPNWKDAASSSELDHPDEMQKKDPLATQIWKLYSKTKTQLPNQERMENLTWRMMAMNLKRKEREQARSVRPHDPFHSDVGTDKLTV